MQAENRRLFFYCTRTDKNSENRAELDEDKDDLERIEEPDEDGNNWKPTVNTV